MNNQSKNPKVSNLQIKNFKYFGDDKTPLYASAVGSGTPLVILHGGGPDRHSILPFAKLLEKHHQIIFPDIRGYGQSVCYDRSKHTWSQYAKDVISLINFIDEKKIFIGGMGLGASIAERVSYTYKDSILGVILISPETFDKDGEGSSDQEKEMMDKCAEVAINKDLEKAWQPFMKDLAPVISNTVRDAFMRTDPKSFAAAMAIVHSKRLDSISQLAEIKAPLLVIPGNDKRHNSNNSETYLELVTNCELGKPFDWNEIKTIDQLASEIAPQIIHFTQKINKNKKFNLLY